MDRKRRPIPWLFLLVAILAMPVPAWSQEMVASRPATADAAADRRPARSALEVHFSPRGGCTEAAKTEILLQAYSFTSAPIAAALVQAHKRGVEVLAILDGGQRTAARSEAPTLRKAGIQVLFDERHPIAHNKLFVIDRRIVLTGSFNFTRQAEANAENLLIVRAPELATQYRANWLKHAEHSDAAGKADR